jgi:hypothetical protein
MPLVFEPIWTRWMTREAMAELTRLLDTSVVVDHDKIDPAILPDESAIAAIMLAELDGRPSVHHIQFR